MEMLSLLCFLVRSRTLQRHFPVGRPTLLHRFLTGEPKFVASAITYYLVFSPLTGHGGQQEDLDGDEEDGFDETLIPVDFDKHGHIVDDDILKVRAGLDL